MRGVVDDAAVNARRGHIVGVLRRLTEAPSLALWWFRSFAVHICLTCVEFFGRGIQGVFGRADDVTAGRPWIAVPRVLQAAWLSPRLMLSPLIATRVARRLVGRAYHRYAGH